MTTVPRFDTDEVFNQSPPYENIDLFGSDLPLKEAVKANGGGETAALSAFGRQWGTAEMFSIARRANEIRRNSTRSIQRDFDAMSSNFIQPTTI